MIPKKQKIAKIILNDEELADQMLKEEQERPKFDWHRFAHYFGIHTYFVRIKNDETNKIVKCKYCKVLHLTSREIKWYSIAFGATCLIGGVIAGPTGWCCLFLGKLIPGFILAPIGTLGIFIGLKRFLENIWMD